MASAYDEPIGVTLKKNLPVIGIIAGVLIVVIGLVFGLGYFFNRGDNGYVYQDGLKRDYNLVQGSDDLGLRFVYFVDYECSVCASNAPTMKELKEKYRDNVQFVYKHYPLIDLHPQANRAAYAVQAANNQGKGFEFADILLKKQADKFSNDTLTKYAQELGLDVAKWDFDRKSNQTKDYVAWDFKDLNESVAPSSSSSQQSKPKGQGSGTPTAFIIKDGQIVDWIPGRLEVAGYSQIIDKYLAQ
jgi:thiol-disulfide isomerase/thioredoxin